MARFSRRTNKKSFRKRTSRKGSRKIRRGAGGYNPLAQFQNKKNVARRPQNTGPKKDFLSQNMSSVTEQSNQNVAQAATALEEEQMRQEQLRSASGKILEQKYAREAEAAAEEERLRREEEARQERIWQREMRQQEDNQRMANYAAAERQRNDRWARSGPTFGKGRGMVAQGF
jgi:hypothetical protein